MIQSAASRLNVLLVEDNDGDAHLIQRNLRARRLRLERAQSLTEALTHLTKGSWLDALILDLNLPDSDGLDTLSTVRGQTDDLPIIVLTGAGDEQAGLEAVRLGADDYLDKADLSPLLLLRALDYSVERRRLQSRLRQSQKLEAIGQLAGGIAHDFNNMLMVIDQSAELAQARLNDPKTVSRRLKQIRLAAQRSAALTRQILAFARKQALQVSIVGAAEVVAETQQLLERALGEHIRLRVEDAEEEARIEVDPTQLQQVLINLALNARDAMPQGGELRIRSRVMEVEAAAATERGDGLEAGRYVVFEVEDTGSGIEAELLDRVFEPFFTTKPAGVSTGLGLAVVHGVVKQNGGHVFVRSEAGQGTTFEVFFPAVAAVPAGQRDGVASSPRGQTVLLAEDEPLVRGLIAEALTSLGLEVLIAGSGEEALALAEEHPGELALLVSDVVMPGMSGGELAERLSERQPGLPILLLSGYAGPVLTQRTPLSVPHDFLAKPVSTSRLKEVVQEILELDP